MLGISTNCSHWNFYSHLALVAAFMNYWIWYNAIVVESIVGCSSGIAISISNCNPPATTNTCIVSNIFKTIFIDVVEEKVRFEPGAIFRDRLINCKRPVSKASKLLTNK